jgi:hypothetical protein
MAGVVLDSAEQISRAAIVQQEDALSQAPQRSCAELVAASVALLDVIRQARTHVMDLNIGIGAHFSFA